MRRLPLLLTLALLATLLAALGSPSTGAAASTKQATTVSLRLAPDQVTYYANGTVEPTGLVAQVIPAKDGRVVTFQQQDGTAWRTLVRTRTDTTGRAFLPLAVTETGSSAYRVAVAGTTYFKPAVSTTRSLRVNADTSCTPSVPPVDGGATGEVFCLLTRLDRWGSNALMGIGQQVNISRDPGWDVPIAGITPAVVGFDLEELGQAATAAFPYVDRNVQGLLDRAKAGSVLVASWHAPNPFTGGPYNTPPQGLAPLLNNPESAAYQAFWADWDAKLQLLKRFQDGDSDADGDDGAVDGERTAVVVRALHEVNGGFFWWGKPTPSIYQRLYAELQRRATEAGVHNVVWGYSGNRKTSSTTDPAAYVPLRVDVGGLDSYDPEIGQGNAVDVLGLEGYAAIDRVARVTRMALTEVGPHGSRDGSWNPAAITTTVRKAGVRPLWAMLWFDDGVPSGSDTASGKKQIGSLVGGRAWFRSCFNSLCYLR
ncbi:MAG: hypothetical protein JWN84_3329 [Nocardioides sp.]|nr:hypothetical protein [Nocardioides sp.]